jgi:hypothetical protein
MPVERRYLEDFVVGKLFREEVLFFYGSFSTLHDAFGVNFFTLSRQYRQWQLPDFEGSGVQESWVELSVL